MGDYIIPKKGLDVKSLVVRLKITTSSARGRKNKKRKVSIR